MSKRADVTAMTRQNIIEAFWQLYCEKRIDRITVKEIAKRAGYNRGTFYEYFVDVADVLEELEDSLIPTLSGLPPVSTPSASFGMPLDAFLAIFKKNARYYSVLLSERGDPAFAGKFKNSIKPLLQQALQGKSGADPIELEYVLEYTLSAMIGILAFWLSQENPLSSERIFGLIQRLMQHGVLNQLMM